MTRQILFLCPHSAAKSVMAAAYFTSLTPGTDFVAACAGTEPDDQIAPHVAELLSEKDIDFAPYQPRRVTAEDLDSAFRIVSLGCTPDELELPAERIEMWADVPAPSQNINGAWDVITTHVQQLVAELVPHQ
jgi:protein-tyrosine-phosphatase